MKNTELNRVLSKIDEWRDEIIADLQALVKFESYQQQGTETEPYGKQVTLALNYMLERGVRFGLHTHNYDNRIGHVEIGGSGRVYGSTESDGELIALLAHLDVVPEGNGWTQPPYEGKIITDNNGAMRMYGRGTEDDKGPAVASLYALRALAETGTPLNNKRVRLLLGCDEEVGMSDMAYYREVGEMPTIGFTPDGGYPAIFAEKGIVTSVVEGAGIVDPDATHNTSDAHDVHDVSDAHLPAITIMTIEGGDKDNKVPENCHSHILLGSSEVVARMKAVFNGVVAELPKGAELSWVITSMDANNTNTGAYQYPYQATISARGFAAHAMAPEKGINAIAIMMNTLTRVFAAVGETNTLLDYFQTYYIGDAHRIEGCDTRGRCVEANHRDEPSGELTWNTAIIQYKGAHPATATKNSTNFTFSITHNIRYCVTLSWDKLGKEIASRLSQYDVCGFTVTVRDRNHLPPLYVERDTRLINAVSHAYKNVTGDTNAVPQSSGGGTYARGFHNFVAVGFAIRNKEAVAHQADEYIYIDDLMDSTKIYATAIYNLINSEE